MARYVAVSDSDKAYAGYDGGPATGGKGRWRVGEVGEWTSSGKMPLAERDPNTGLIHKGWLEEVEEVARKDDGTLIALKSKRVYTTPKVVETKEGQRFAVVGDTLRPATAGEVQGEPPLPEHRPTIADTLTPQKSAPRGRPRNAPPNAGVVTGV